MHKKQTERKKRLKKTAAWFIMLVYECGIVPARFFGTQTKSIKRKGVITIMKKLTKLIFSCAAVAAVTAALGTAALAAGEITDIAYTAGAGETPAQVTFKVGDGTAQAQNTILIIDKGTDTVTDQTPIYYVDQDEAQFTVAKFAENLADGTYEIRVGGTDGSIKTGEFTVGSVVPPSTRKLGDVDGENNAGNGVVNTSDAGIVARVAAQDLTLTGEAAEAADVDDNEVINTNDAGLVARLAVGDLSDFNGKTTVGEKDGDLVGSTPAN